MRIVFSPATRVLVIAGLCAVAAPVLAGHDGKYPPLLTVPAQPFIVIPESPAVTYAPQHPFDVFQYKGRYYTWNNGWFVTNKPGKPWVTVPGNRVPQPVLLVPAQYYRRLPPGQAKKLYGNVPPGQAKHGHNHEHEHDHDHGHGEDDD